MLFLGGIVAMTEGFVRALRIVEANAEFILRYLGFVCSLRGVPFCKWNILGMMNRIKIIA